MAEESALERIPYLLRKHTLKEEMPGLGEEVEMFGRAARRGELVEYKKIMGVVCDTAAGRKVLNTALEMAGRFSSELSVLFYAGISQKLKGEIEAAGIRFKLLSEAGTLSAQVLFAAKKEGADLIILPERFTDSKTQKPTSVATIQIVSDAGVPVMVVR